MTRSPSPSRTVDITDDPPTSETEELISTNARTVPIPEGRPAHSIDEPVAESDVNPKTTVTRYLPALFLALLIVMVLFLI